MAERIGIYSYAARTCTWIILESSTPGEWEVRRYMRDRWDAVGSYPCPTAAADHIYHQTTGIAAWDDLPREAVPPDMIDMTSWEKVRVPDDFRALRVDAPIRDTDLYAAEQEGFVGLLSGSPA